MSWEANKTPRIRKDFGKIKKILDVPNLIDIQRRSYEKFLQLNKSPEEREDKGLQEVFKSVFPIKDFSGLSSLHFVKYTLGEVKYDQEECLAKGMTYEVPIKITVRLVVYDRDKDTGEETIRDIKEQEVYFGTIPLMTENGTFIINGTERVVVSQLHRSPGIFFEHDQGKTHTSGKLLYSARLIPLRGSWIDLEYDHKDNLYVRIDRRRKLPVTLLLKAMGYTTSQILEIFYPSEEIYIDGEVVRRIVDPSLLLGYRATEDVYDPETGELLVGEGKKFTKKAIRRLEETDHRSFPTTFEALEGRILMEDVIDPETGEIIAQANEILTSERIQEIRDRGIEKLKVLLLDTGKVATIRESLIADKVDSQEEALLEIYRKLRPSNPPVLEIAQTFFHNLFFNPETYDLSPVGRFKLNQKLDLDIPLEVRTLVPKDGYSRFLPSHILNPQELLSMLKEGANASEPTPYRRVWELLDEELRQDIEKDNIPKKIDEKLVKRIVDSFNGLLRKVDLYDPEYMGEELLTQEMKEMVARDLEDLPPFELQRFNRLLLQKIFPKEIRPNYNDILETIIALVKLKEEEGPIDDIDSLSNRRVRSVGELIENQFRIGLVRMERAIKERMSLQEVESLMPHDLVNSKPVSAVVKEFFGTSQLSQFMDQTNPLSEITHKRRLSALGPGGLTRERAGFEVRDVHPTHYGRICPIETPEGPNIGLIVSLSTYARINQFGFIENPYRKVVNGRVTKEIKYLAAYEEKDYVFAQANAPIDEEGRFIKDLVSARRGGEFVMVKPEEVDFMDVSPLQLVSVAAGLIPFLENDDANRALMGSNMQRQAVPLLCTQAPLVGTGLEKIVARDSGVAIMVERDGVIEDVDATRIVVAYDDKGTDGVPVEIFKLKKFRRSNQNTCFNQKPIVRRGQKVRAGQIIADGPSTESGELALGRNIMVAFMPWGGYNFEDSILVSERLVKEDIYTSIHIEEFEVMARDTKLGPEEITRDIPNLGEESLKNLDESGIIRIGAEVKPGDILVGKITPKGETQLSPEEKLLRAIFGEKAGDVKDTSLRVPPGVQGTVIHAAVFARRGVEKDARAKAIEQEELARLQRDEGDQIVVVEREAFRKLSRLLAKKKSQRDVVVRKKVIISKGEEITEEILRRLPLAQWRKYSDIVDDLDIQVKIERIIDAYQEEVAAIRQSFEEKVARLTRGDELPPGVIKMVKVYVAIKRKLSVGDKMAGRHGNKGVVSRILPEEDMPFFADGTPVDMVLNPLGVPSRMNVGQVLETHLGWASYELARQIRELIENYQRGEEARKLLLELFEGQEVEDFLKNATIDELKEFMNDYKDGILMASPVFDSAKEEEIKELLSKAKLPRVGQTILRDGRTGEPFQQPVTVGMMYMMKLHHLVDDKIHARSIGPYSLVTQQPLGGKAQFGGQRLGEMEVWAMEAYGAAYALQEFLTVKSDDVTGRTRMYEKIVKGDNTLEAGLPESFKVLVKELQALSLDINLIEEGSDG